MQEPEFIDLDDFLAVKGDWQENKLVVYEAILAGLLRKYLKPGNKIELNLNHSYKDTYLDVMISSEGKTKISWEETDASI